MAEVEMLTDEERETLSEHPACMRSGPKALRIIGQLTAALAEARAEVERLSTERDAANGLLERASVRLDETNYPEWWKAYRVHLSGQPAAPKPAVYEVWVGTEKTKERIVKETNDIEDAARTACADLSGCTFWGMKIQSAVPSQFALDVIARVGDVTLTDLPESPNEDEP